MIALETQLSVSLGESGNPAELSRRQLIEPLDAGTVVGFGKHNVEADDRNLVLVEKLGDQTRHHIPGPGPAGDFLKAFFVYVQDDDALVNPARHGDLQPCVIDDMVQLVDDSDLVELRRVADEDQHDDQTQDNPDNVLLHSVSFRQWP